MITLKAVEKGTYKKPWVSLIYGPVKIGKTTFASKAPNPIFLDTQHGSFHVDTSRINVERWEDVTQSITALATEDHDYKTLVIDSIDDVEAFLWQHMCARDSKSGIEEYGWAKGYVAALEEWRVFFASLEQLQAKTGMDIIILGHAIIKLFKDPDGEDYERYQLKLHQKAADFFREKTDCFGFANHKTYTSKNERTSQHKGFGGDERYLFLTRKAAYDAGNRYCLPGEMPLDWSTFQAAMDPKSPAQLLKEIDERVNELGDEKVTAWVNENIKGADQTMLTRINNRLATKLAEKEESNDD